MMLIQGEYNQTNDKSKKLQAIIILKMQKNSFILFLVLTKIQNIGISFIFLQFYRLKSRQNKLLVMF
jgi:hypothetical protein